jgi:TrmH family RNA methyltransferase
VTEFKVILVEPKFEGNIGAIARVMKNFGLSDLALINPCEIGDDCLSRAKHAKDVVESAEIFEDIQDATSDIDYLVGTSGVDSKSDKKHLRNNLTPKEFASRTGEIEGKIGIMFGRENYGLYNDELRNCDTVITISSSKEYPILNLSHSASIIFYEMFEKQVTKKEKKEASGFEKTRMMTHFSELLDKIDYPQHKKKKTKVMFQRILGRAVLTKWEFHTLMGVFSRAQNKLSKMEERLNSQNQL